MQISKDTTKVYIDFDDTLCNTLLEGGFAEGYFEFLARITQTSVDKIYETLPKAILDVRNTGFPVYNTLAHVALFSSEDHSHEIEQYIKINIASYVFKDSKPFLTALKVAGKKTCILSYGDNWFQKLKITHSGLAQLVDEVVVVQGDKLSYIKRRTPDGEKPLIIDDKLLSFEHSADYPDITCALIDREHKNNSVEQYDKINSFFDVEFAIL